MSRFVKGTTRKYLTRQERTNILVIDGRVTPSAQENLFVALSRKGVEII